MTLPSSEDSPIAVALAAARRREPTQEQLDAMERSLLVAATAVGAAGVSAAVAGRVGTWIGALKIGVAIVVPAAVAGVVWHTTQRTPSPPPRERPVVAAGSARPRPIALQPVPEPPMAAAPPEEVPRPRATPRPSASTLRPVPSEVELVSLAQRTLATSPAEALALTEECARRYAGGSMREENEVIAISALARLGRMDEARARAEKFASRYPTSGYLRRIEAEIGDTP
jgi:hypothetical protein